MRTRELSDHETLCALITTRTASSEENALHLHTTDELPSTCPHVELRKLKKKEYSRDKEEETCDESRERERSCQHDHEDSTFAGDANDMVWHVHGCTHDVGDNK